MLTSTFGLDPEIAAALAALGPVLNPAMIERSRALFADRKDMSLPEGGVRLDDVAYGVHPRQRLDLTVAPGSGKPIVLFVPGGGLVGGDKAFYAHIPPFFARKGYLAAAMNYRLAPEFLWPEGGRDVAQAIDWLAEHATEHGGDPTRLFIVGQSAGAVHVACAIFDKRLHPRHIGDIRSVALMSGIYDVVPDHQSPNINRYFGDDAAVLRDRSSVWHVAESDVPVFVTVAEYDPPYFGTSAGALIKALSERDGKAPEFTRLRAHNHLSPVLGMGGPGDELGDAIEHALKEHAR